MRSISCTLISIAMFYMAVYINATKWMLKGILALLSLGMLVVSVILMVFGL